MGQTLASAQSHQKETPRRLPPCYSLGRMSLAKPTQLKGFRAAVGCAAPSTGTVVGAGGGGALPAASTTE